MARQVKINFTLVGKSFNIKHTENLNSASILEDVKCAVHTHFGSRAVLITDEELVMMKSEYPRFYAAGWFVSDEPIHSGPGSELVVVSHGDSMEAAQSEVLRAISFTDWDLVARDI